MGQLLKITGVIVMLAGGGGPAWAAASLKGAYQGQLGRVDFETDSAGKVTGRYGEGGVCGFEVKQPILDGEFEGNVLVGKVTLCQTGPACNERAYNILAFYDPAGGVLTADVKLEAGCESPALKNSRLVLQAARDVPAPKAVDSAAGKQTEPRRSAEECTQSLTRGIRQLERREYPGAAFYFEQALACDDQNWIAHMGLGVAELKRGNLDPAISSLERARDLARQAGQDDMGVYYNLACAHARRGERLAALKNLRKSIDLGWADPNAMNTDPDLQALHNDREFNALVDRAWENKDRSKGAEGEEAH